jgi:hypothetical protein
MKLVVVAVALAAGWSEQPTVGDQAWGDRALGAFGVTAATETTERMRAGDAFDGFREAAAAAGIEVGEPIVDGPVTTAPIRRGRWRGEARLRAADRRLEMQACFHTDRRPDQAEADCRTFMAGAPP